MSGICVACCCSHPQRPHEGIPPQQRRQRVQRVPTQADPGFGPTPELQVAELRLCIAKLGHERLGYAAMERLGVRADGDLLRLLAECVVHRPLVDSVIVGSGSDAELRIDTPP